MSIIVGGVVRMSHKHSDGFGFSLIVVLFILLIIVGVAYSGGYDY